MAIRRWSFFYDKAVKLYGDKVDIAAFRYEGPRPRSREAAVVMLADTIEAAARALPDPDPEKIDALIRKLVRAKMTDGQLDESELTFADLDRICRAFQSVLSGVFHERIEYPDIAIPPAHGERSRARAGGRSRGPGSGNGGYRKCPLSCNGRWMSALRGWKRFWSACAKPVSRSKALRTPV